MKLMEALNAAKAEVARIEREIAAGPCREYGHDWKLLGGCNAECSDWCGCSVPVYQCAKCSDCDYGDNSEAVEIRETCAEKLLLEIGSDESRLALEQNEKEG